MGNINNLFDVIISLFSVDSEGTSGGDDSIKDSLVFHGVPKDTYYGGECSGLGI